MHMADALVSPAVAATMYVCAGAATAYSIRKVRMEDDAKKIPVMGVMGAFVFAAQMINFTIPGTGSSGHLCGGLLLSAVLGPYAGFLAMIGVLLIQCLLFADGGLLALGCNVWNMAFYGCFIGSLLLWKPMMRNGASKKKIVLASIAGCMLTLQLGAFSVTLETLASRVTALPFTVFAAAMQPIHLAIGFVEGLITAAVLCFVYEARPELLWGIGGTACSSKEKTARLSLSKTLGILVILTAAVGGILSLFASAFPDGLEWSLERITGSAELEAAGSAYDTAAAIQETTALLPDYAFKGSDSLAGTSFSGIVGAVIVIAFCMVCCRLFQFFKGKHRKFNE
ncbi:MAG: energy-coupling factor ABC transporter permease [Lachnospiraceae bacterium]|nr:energy-coupling factor ABC transporter permease [Lachnospiraceae bacterium]